MIWFVVIFLSFVTLQSTHADSARVSEADLRFLPDYCKATQGIRKVSKVPQSVINAYYAKYGPTFHHMHHYCWALNGERKAMRMTTGNEMFIKSVLGSAIGDIDYVLRHIPNQNYVLLPTIYTSKARILFKLGRTDEAVDILKKTIKIRKNYVPAYARLSDYYVRKGDTNEAIKILKQGIARSKHSNMLTRRLKRLQH